MPIQHDRDICSAITLRYLSTELLKIEQSKQEFQFPPKILSDTRGATWDEGDMLGREPEANLSKVGARIMSLQWTYIVEAIGNPDGDDDKTESPWTIRKIRTEVNKVRGYFVNVNPLDALRKNMIVMIQHNMITGRGPWTCRIVDVNVKHSDNLIGPAGYVYPVRTDITVDLRLWTTGVEGVEGGLNNPQAVQKIRELFPEPAFSDLWY